jgi:outer membrane receptor protein involved in Fe transport
VYDRSGDIPEAPRGSGMTTEDGFKTRTPTLYTLDLHADYALPIAAGRFVLAVDVFNLLDEQTVTSYDQDTETGYLDPNPDFGRRDSYQPPREVRLALRFEF